VNVLALPLRPVAAYLLLGFLTICSTVSITCVSNIRKSKHDQDSSEEVATCHGCRNARFGVVSNAISISAGTRIGSKITPNGMLGLTVRGSTLIRKKRADDPRWNAGDERGAGRGRITMALTSLSS
jgi:hypothetical protein